MRGKAWIAVVVLILLVLLAAAAAPFFLSPWGRGYGWGMTQAPAPWAGVGPWMSGGWGMMGMMFLGPILVLVVIGLFVAGAVWLFQSASRGGQQPTSTAAGDTSLDILKRRYAGGEISKEQFEEMRKALVQS